MIVLEVPAPRPPPKLPTFQEFYLESCRRDAERKLKRKSMSMSKVGDKKKKKQKPEAPAAAQAVSAGAAVTAPEVPAQEQSVGAAVGGTSTNAAVVSRLIQEMESGVVSRSDLVSRGRGVFKPSSRVPYPEHVNRCVSNGLRDLVESGRVRRLSEGRYEWLA